MPTVPPEVESHLASETLSAHLATSVDDRPHVAPVWYDYRPDAESLEVVTKGTKLENVRANPRVALSIEQAGDAEPFLAVTIRGTATLTDDEDEVRAATKRIFSRYLGDDVDDWDDLYRSAYEEASHTLVTIRIGSVAGVF